jgi:hypothetical protein
MSFMSLYMTQKGSLYSCDCAKCGATLYSHEWVDDVVRNQRSEWVGVNCDQCAIGRADPETFQYHGKQYAARYSANGYMDCTEWTYGANKRTLAREVNDMYGEE